MKILFFSSHAHLVLDETSTRTSGGAELQVALLARELAAPSLLFAALLWRAPARLLCLLWHRVLASALVGR